MFKKALFSMVLESIILDLYVPVLFNVFYLMPKFHGQVRNPAFYIEFDTLNSA